MLCDTSLMQYKIVISPSTLVRRLMIGVLVLVAIGTAVQIGKYGFNYRADWMRIFNLDREMNLPSWYSALMLGFCALVLKTISAGKKNNLTATTTTGGYFQLFSGY